MPPAEVGVAAAVADVGAEEEGPPTVCAPCNAICHDNGISESEETEKLGDTGISCPLSLGGFIVVPVVVVDVADVAGVFVVVPIVVAVADEASDILFALSRSKFSHGGGGI